MNFAAAHEMAARLATVVPDRVAACDERRERVAANLERVRRRLAELRLARAGGELRLR